MPAEGGAAAAAELPRLLPAPLKLLRTLKFCEGASPEPRTQVGQADGWGCCGGTLLSGGCGLAPAGARREPRRAHSHLFARPLPTHERAQEAHQLCDVGLMLAKAIADRLRGGKGGGAEPARFPGQVVLPRMCFRPNLGDRSEWLGRVLGRLWLLAVLHGWLPRGHGCTRCQ